MIAFGHRRTRNEFPRLHQLLIMAKSTIELLRNSRELVVGQCTLYACAVWHAHVRNVPHPGLTGNAIQAHQTLLNGKQFNPSAVYTHHAANIHQNWIGDSQCKQQICTTITMTMRQIGCLWILSLIVCAYNVTTENPMFGWIKCQHWIELKWMASRYLALCMHRIRWIATMSTMDHMHVCKHNVCICTVSRSKRI